MTELSTFLTSYSLAAFPSSAFELENTWTQSWSGRNQKRKLASHSFPSSHLTMDVFTPQLTLCAAAQWCWKTLIKAAKSLWFQTLFNICVWSASVCQRFDPSHFLPGGCGGTWQASLHRPGNYSTWLSGRNFWQGETLSSLTDGTRQPELKVLQDNIKRYRLWSQKERFSFNFLSS